ncbi:MAG: HAMP domain-containing protein [Erysipelotrichaceae bacterium]|nr:HAMP domain-containing protein [Erysipelotrichaceae bacterium]
MRNSKLHVKVLIALVLFALSIILFSSILVSNLYSKTKMEESRQLSFSYAKTAAGLIDGDKVETYAETLEKDEYYDQVKYYFDTTLKTVNSTMTDMEMRYYYVFVPYEDTVVYIWDAENNYNQSYLGDSEGYMEGGKEAVEKIYRQDPPEELSVATDPVYGFIVSAYYPVFNSANKPVAVVGVDLSMPGLQAREREFVGMIVNSVLGVTLVMGAILYFFVRRGVVNPLLKLNDAAKELVEGLDSKEMIDLDIKTGDEVQELAKSFKKMQVDLNDYIERLSVVTAEREKIGAELNVAKSIQMDMMPQIFPAFPERNEFDIYATVDPAREVGGDFYDFFMIDDDHLGLVIADVSGKGVPAALFMVIAKTLIKNRAMMGGGPGEILTDVNRQLCEGNDAGMFVTVWFAIIELSTGKGLAANAGHEHPVLRRKDGSYELVVYRHSPIVAVVEDAVISEHPFRMNTGDRLLVYTDGVPEAMNPELEQYGTARLLDVMNANAECSSREMLRKITLDVEAFMDDSPQADDITMLIFDFYGTSQSSSLVLELEATRDNLQSVLDFVNEHLDEINCPKKARMQLNLTVEEIYINIASYAYTPNIGMVKVVLDDLKNPDGVRLTFIDQGVPYNPLAKADPDVTLPAEQRPIGGLGIYLVKKNMDKVEYKYENNSNVLAMTKYFKK